METFLKIHLLLDEKTDTTPCKDDATLVTGETACLAPSASTCNADFRLRLPHLGRMMLLVLLGGTMKQRKGQSCYFAYLHFLGFSEHKIANIIHTS